MSVKRPETADAIEAPAEPVEGSLSGCSEEVGRQVGDAGKVRELAERLPFDLSISALVRGS